MIGLVRAFDGDADVVGLLLGEGRELHTDLGEVKAGDFFVELLGKHGHADGAGVRWRSRDSRGDLQPA